MKKGLAVLLLVLASYAGPVTLLRAAEEQKPATPEQKPAEPEDKPLGPGWLSLDCCVGPIDNAIGNGKGALEKALGISISGYLDAGWTFSTNHPNHPANISGRYFDKDQNKVEFNDFNITLDKPEKDWGVGFHLSGDFGRTAELLREATLWGRTFHREPSAELREAFVTTTIPIGEGLGIKGGLFVTPLGTEILPNPGAFNDNISRSFLFNFAVPLRHLGMMLSYPVSKVVGLSAGVVTGWDDPRDNHHTPAFLGGVTVTPNDKITIASNVIAGEEPISFSSPSAKNTARMTWSTVGTFKPIDPLALSLEFTYGHQRSAALNGTSNADWYGIAGIASYSWTDRFTTALRGEWFGDPDGARLGGDLVSGRADVNVGQVTLTGPYKFTKMLLGRLELRQDFADGKGFRVGDTAARATNIPDQDPTTFGLQLIYQY